MQFVNIITFLFFFSSANLALGNDQDVAVAVPEMANAPALKARAALPEPKGGKSSGGDKVT